MDVNKFYLKSSENMEEIEDNSINLIVTSPPYNIGISYGNQQINGKKVRSKGIKYQDNKKEESYRQILSNVFEECKRVLSPNGSIYLNIKNRYKNDMILHPFWILDYFSDLYLRNIIIWNFDWGGSTNRRFSPRYEYVFWFTKNPNTYAFNLDSIKIPSLNYRPDRYKTQNKNPSDVWYIQMVSGNYPERTNHPAQFPEELIERIIKVGSNEGDIVLDPFMGSGTVARVAKDLNRKYIGYETVPEYVEICKKRLQLPKRRKKKKSNDVRPLYMELEDEDLSNLVKINRKTNDTENLMKLFSKRKNKTINDFL